LIKTGQRTTSRWNLIFQLEETTNSLTTVTISGSKDFHLGRNTMNSNTGDGVVTDLGATAASPTTINSALTLIDASATTGMARIFAGATNTPGAGTFVNGGSLNANVTITYTGLTIKGGSGDDFIENDAQNGIVTAGNGEDQVILGGGDATATLGAGAHDKVFVGFSFLGTRELSGHALGDTVTFGAAATAELLLGRGAEVGATADTANIGLTKVVNAADGMKINTLHPSGDHIVDETAVVASATSLTAAENAAVSAMGRAGVAYFSFQGNEYFIATNHKEAVIDFNDTIVELVGITNIHHATNSGGLVTLHV
jgi:hypothetical protein